MKEKLKRLLAKLNLQRAGAEQFLMDINRDCAREQKKILICYLDYMRTVRELKEHFGHTNRQEMMQIVKVCIDNGWRIDVCACYDSNACTLIRQNYYDYILGFGETFRYALRVNPQAFSMIYMTENPYAVSFERESERIAYFKERTGRDFKLERTGVYYQQGDERLADAVICFGDTVYFKETGKKIVRIMPSALKNPGFHMDFSKKDTRSFLVYGVDGFVHKGNDILVEVFAKHPDWQLYLCGARGDEKAKEAGYTLPPNVHACGFVDTLSDAFLDLAGKCCYILLPSCSEALPTSVITGMRHGLIPIVSKGIGLDGFSECCRYFTGYHVNQIDADLQDAVLASEEELKALACSNYEFADREFTLERFTEHMREAVKSLTGAE